MNAITVRAGSTSLAPQSFGEALEFSKMLAKSGMVPKDYVGKPENVMVALQWGAEVGLGPLQALNGISIINGRPSLWGDAALALVRAHPACTSIREGVDGEGDARQGWCEVVRGKEPMQRRTFSMADAKKAGLAGKAGPWTQYPDRMLQLRARGFAIRDVFPDALRGVITVEEARDMPVEAMPAARGETINSTAERVAAAVEEPRYTLVQADASVIDCPSLQHWQKWFLRELGKLESAEALVTWREAMRPHIAVVAQDDPTFETGALSEIEDRLDALANAAGA
jgi:hypothetical protein